MNKWIFVLCLAGMCLSGAAQQATSVEVIERKLAWACLSSNAQAIQDAAIELAKSSAYGADKLEYASNLLSSVEANGILFTGSKGDTYPVLILQYLKSMRTDVRIVHVDWMSDAAYFQSLQAAVGIENNEASGIRSLSRKIPVYVSLSANAEIIGELESELYCTGLAFKCSAAPLSNVKMMHNEWWPKCGKKFMNSGYTLNANYLVALAMLADYAKETGNSNEYSAIKQRYAEIAKSVGEEEQLPAIK
jgi:hypothetical protein